MAIPQSVFVNLTQEVDRTEREGSHGPKILDYSALKGKTLGEENISFLVTTDDVRILPSEGSVIPSIFTDGLEEVATKHNEPIIWILTDYIGLTNGLDTRIRLFVCGDFFLIGLIKGRIFLETDDGVTVLDRNYSGVREDPVWFIPDEFPNLSNTQEFRDGLWDLTIRATHYGKTDKFIDYRSKPTPGYPILLDGGYWENLRVLQETKEREAKEAVLRAKEELQNARKAAQEKKRMEQAAEISAGFLSMLQADANKKAV